MLHSPQTVSSAHAMENEIAELPSEPQPYQPELRKAINSGIRMLARRERTRSQLLHKLCEKGYEPDLAESAVNDLVRTGLQSDARYAESRARELIHRGKGPLWIERALAADGIPESTASHALSCAIGSLRDGDEDDGAFWEARARKALGNRHTAPANAMDFLRGRGFRIDRQGVEVLLGLR